MIDLEAKTWLTNRSRSVPANGRRRAVFEILAWGLGSEGIGKGALVRLGHY
jgi:hypothetical protein